MKTSDKSSLINAGHLVVYLSEPKLKNKPVFVSIDGELQTVSGCKALSDSEIELMLNESGTISPNSLSTNNLLAALQEEIKGVGSSELNVVIKGLDESPLLYPGLYFFDRVLVLSTKQGLE